MNQEYSPGQRIKSAATKIKTRVADRERIMNSEGMQDMMSVPDNPGPAVTGRTPVLGSVRRSRDMPVLRDQLTERFN